MYMIPHMCDIFVIWIYSLFKKRSILKLKGYDFLLLLKVFLNFLLTTVLFLICVSIFMLPIYVIVMLSNCFNCYFFVKFVCLDSIFTFSQIVSSSVMCCCFKVIFDFLSISSYFCSYLWFQTFILGFYYSSSFHLLFFYHSFPDVLYFALSWVYFQDMSGNILRMVHVSFS